MASLEHITDASLARAYVAQQAQVDRHWSEHQVKQASAGDIEADILEQALCIVHQYELGKEAGMAGMRKVFRQTARSQGRNAARSGGMTGLRQMTSRVNKTVKMPKPAI